MRHLVLALPLVLLVACAGGGGPGQQGVDGGAEPGSEGACTFDGKTYAIGEEFVSPVNGTCVRCVGGVDKFRTGTCEGAPKWQFSGECTRDGAPSCASHVNAGLFCPTEGEVCVRENDAVYRCGGEPPDARPQCGDGG